MQKKQPHSSTSSSLAAILVVLFVVTLLVGLALRFWASEKEYEFAGPTHITAGPGGIYVFASGNIHHLSPQGALLNVAGVERTLLSDDPIDLRLLASGELLVAEQRPASVRLCDTATWDCRGIGDAAFRQIERQFKVLPGSDKTWLVTDASGDAFWSFDQSSGEMIEALPPNTLAGPNGLARDAEGNPWIADTDHRRIVELLPVGDGTYTTGREHSAVNDLTIGKRFYPMMIELGADGRLWVAQAAEFSEANSDLVVYDPEEGAVAVADFPAGAYATDLAVLGDDVLVTDLERFTVYRVDNATMSVEEFGDASFGAVMQEYQAQRALYARVGVVALIVTVVSALFMILAAIRLTPREKRWSQVPPTIDFDSAPETVPPVTGVHWLERNAKFNWLSRWLEKSYYVLFGLLCLVSATIYGWSCQQPWPVEESGLSASDRLGLLLLLACLVVASFIPMIRFAAAAFKRRIGTDGRRIHLELDNGRRMAVEPERIAWNNRALLYRQYTFPMQTGRKNLLYADGEVKTWLAPMLRGAEQMTEWQTLKHQWKHRDALLLAAWGAVVFMLLVLLLVQVLKIG